MANRFAEMDEWTSEQVMLFKEPAISQEIEADLAGAEFRRAAERVGKILAQGDSWFDYLPGTDIIDCLKKIYGYDISNYATAGDTLGDF